MGSGKEVFMPVVGAVAQLRQNDSGRDKKLPDPRDDLLAVVAGRSIVLRRDGGGNRI